MWNFVAIKWITFSLLPVHTDICLFHFCCASRLIICEFVLYLGFLANSIITFSSTGGLNPLSRQPLSFYFALKFDFSILAIHPHVFKVVHSYNFFYLIIDQDCNLGVYFHRVPDKGVLLTPVQATDQEETITIVTPCGSVFTRQIKTDEVTAVQETNPATQGQMVFKTFSIPLKQWQ